MRCHKGLIAAQRWPFESQGSSACWKVRFLRMLRDRCPKGNLSASDLSSTGRPLVGRTRPSKMLLKMMGFIGDFHDESWLWLNESAKRTINENSFSILQQASYKSSFFGYLHWYINCSAKKWCEMCELCVYCMLVYIYIAYNPQRCY